jgi:lactate dehydrogenase-like 2-hydroxyacid dehydrogenase
MIALGVDHCSNNRPQCTLEEILGPCRVSSRSISASHGAVGGDLRRAIQRYNPLPSRPGVVLINVARGGLVDQQALAAALASGQVSGAGLDVVDPEPLPASNPLWTAPNLIISPHFAGGGSVASQMRLAESAAANLRRLIKGEPLQHLVS